MFNLNRKNSYLTQTPQAFKFKDVYDLSIKQKSKIQDEATLFIENNLKLNFIKGEILNNKITFKEDIINTKTYFVIGFDIHRLIKNKKLYLGGIKIPFHSGLKGHSDGDVILHAIIDAILGAMRKKDIGTFFPDNKNKFKNIRSPNMLEPIIKILNKNNFVCRALDNRMGGFMIAQVARLLHENKKTLPFGLYITNSVQEEIGLRGAEMISHTIQPDVAIITDVTHDTTTPMINKKVQGHCELGKGPVIAYAPAVQQKLRDLITETAEENKIPFQRAALSRATGTDTDAFAYSNGGVASALISLPLRYMHTTVEMVHRDDVEDVIKMIYETLLKIENGETFSYFD